MAAHRESPPDDIGCHLAVDADYFVEGRVSTVNGPNLPADACDGSTSRFRTPSYTIDVELVDGTTVSLLRVDEGASLLDLKPGDEIVAGVRVHGEDRFLLNFVRSTRVSPHSRLMGSTNLLNAAGRASCAKSRYASEDAFDSRIFGDLPIFCDYQPVVDDDEYGSDEFLP